MALVLASAPAQAQDGWTCRNEAVEVTCGKGKCTVAKEHTPLEVTVDPGGGLTVCAYSGCWEGRTTLRMESETHLTVYSGDLRWQQTPDKPGIPGSVTIDRKAATGTALAAGFAVPMTCVITEAP